MRRFTTFVSALCFGSPVIACSADEAPPPEVAPRQPTRPTPGQSGKGIKRERLSAGRVYVPTYSHIYAREGSPEDLAVTLSVRNVSSERELAVESVRYHDTKGTLIEELLESETVLGPLQTAEFFIPTADRRGGSGANIIVRWHADSPVLKPLIEAVMVRSIQVNQAYAFSTRGIELPNAEGAAPPAPSKPERE